MIDLDKLTNNGSFCVLPFIHQEKKFNGTHHICCYGDQLQSHVEEENSLTSFNSTKMSELREAMIQGVKNSACDYCYKQEHDGLYSPRMRENSTWLGWPESKKSVEANVNKFYQNEILHPISYDLRYSNTCTLKCRMCNSYSSSAINQEYKKIHHHWPEKFWTIKNPRINHDIELDQNIQKIYLAGGEPLVEPYNLNLLNELLDKNIDVNLLINTSLNNLSVEFIEVLNRFQNLTLVVSIDGVGPVNDYIRHGSAFDKIKENIKKMSHHNMMFSTCISMYNLYDITNLFHFVKKEFPEHEQNHSFNLVNDVEELSIENMPIELRHDIIFELDKLLPLASDLPKKGINNIINVLQKDNFYAENFERFVQYTKILDQTRNESLNNIAPQLYKYFNE